MVTVKVGVRLAVVFALVLMALASDAAVGSATSSANTTTVKVRIINMNGTTCTKFFCYKPGKLMINAGTTVTWVNTTGVSHTVSRCTVAACGVSGGTGIDPAFGSGVIPAGGSYTFTFTHKGSYVYYCQIHGYSIMHARVIEVT